MRSTGAQVCTIYTLLFTILFLLSVSGVLGSSSRTLVVKEQVRSNKISISKLVISNDFVNSTNNSTFLMNELHLPPPSPPDDYGSDNNGMGSLSSCSNDDIVIYQGPTSPLPSGIPTYTVDILNACAADCSISNIHVRCGWFSSARLIDPTVFRRLSYDDCLVNDGETLDAGESLSFQYANSFRYPLSVSSVDCF